MFWLYHNVFRFGQVVEIQHFEESNAVAVFYSENDEVEFAKQNGTVSFLNLYLKSFYLSIQSNILNLEKKKNLFY